MTLWHYKVYAYIHRVPWIGGVKRQWGNENVDLRCFRTLYLLNLR